MLTEQELERYTNITNFYRDSILGLNWLRKSKPELTERQEIIDFSYVVFFPVQFLPQVLTTLSAVLISSLGLSQDEWEKLSLERAFLAFDSYYPEHMEQRLADIALRYPTKRDDSELN